MNTQWNSKNPPASENAIEAFEKEFSVKLPDDYREFLRTINGGQPDSDMFDPIYERDFAVSALFSLGGERPYELTHMNCHRLHFPEGYIEIGRGQGGDFLGMGISEDNYGKIYGSDHEYEHVEEAEMAIYILADSFSEFISNLKSRN